MNMAGRDLVEFYEVFGPETVFLPVNYGTKSCTIKNWQGIRFPDTQNTKYQQNLLDGNLGVLVGEPSQNLVGIDLDADELRDMFVRYNPGLRKTLCTAGANGCNYWLRLRGEYPKCIRRFDKTKKIGEWRGGGGYTVVDGRHPSGTDYRIVNYSQPVEISFSEIKWPNIFDPPDESDSEDDSPSFPPIIAGETIRTIHDPLPPTIITGLLSRGEKGELAGGSKSFKTWALIQQGLSIATEIDWLGLPTLKTDVLFLNLEIPKEFFEDRVRTVADALRIDVPDNFHVWHLRNAKLFEMTRWDAFLRELAKRAADIEHPYVTSDPIYKLLGGRNENAAGDVQTLLSQLDELIEVVDGANFFGHHFSKGSQADKEAIDRAAGSGVFQRDPDSILTMTPLEDEGAFSIELILRNHPPVEPFVIKWSYPIFVRQSGMDPTNLKRAKNAQEKSIERKADPTILVQWLGTEALKTQKLFKIVHGETGMTRATFYRALDKAFAQKLITRDDITHTIEVTGKSQP